MAVIDLQYPSKQMLEDIRATDRVRCTEAHCLTELGELGDVAHPAGRAPF